MFTEMKVSGLTVDPFTNTPIVLLKDLQEERVVPIWIGFFEASAIATQLEGVELSRPMTHDLIKNTLESLGARLMRIEIHDLRDNTFYALIHVEVEGTHHAIDARPSDAIALALRTESPIYVKDEVIEKSGKIEVPQDKEGEEAFEDALKNLRKDDFGKYKM